MEREEERERGVFQTEERDRVKMGGKRWEVCVCVLRWEVSERKKERKMENTGRGRDRRHGQTAKAGVILFSGGTLTSHLSRLTVKRKEAGERTVEGVFFYPLSDKPDDKALSTH